MTVFSIFARDREPTEDSILDLQGPAVLSYRRPSPVVPQSGISESKPLSLTSVLEESTLPEIVLQLPDLTTLPLTPPEQYPGLTARLFWVAIALGGLLALWLIWTPSKPAALRDEAPSWTAPPQGNSSVSPQSNPSAAGWGDRSDDAQLPSGDFEGPGVGSKPSESPEFQEPPARQPTIPDLDAAAARPDSRRHEGSSTTRGLSAGVQPPAEVRTARGGETRWDGGSVGIKPSEAAPLGITTPVPQ